MSIRSLIVLLLFVATPLIAQEPYAGILPDGSDTIYWYSSPRWDRLTPVPLLLIAGPKEANKTSMARFHTYDAAMNAYAATVDVELGATEFCLDVTLRMRTVRACRTILTVEPRLVDGIDAWGALQAAVGERYNPSSNWSSIDIPAAHYQTVVEIDGVTRFDMPGNQFQRSQLPASLDISSSTRSVGARVYWRPQGTPDRALWKLLASTDGSGTPAVPLEARKIHIGSGN